MNHWICCMTEENLRISLDSKTIGYKETTGMRLKAFRERDKVVFYVPRKSFSSVIPVRKLVGVAQVRGTVYRSITPIWDNGIFPQRIAIDVTSRGCCEIIPLINHLSFIKNRKHWGSSF